MIRIAAVFIFAGLVTALFLVPGVSPARLATKQVADLLEEEVEIDANGETQRMRLWEAIVQSDAIEMKTDRTGAPQRVLQVGGARFIVDKDVYQEGETFDPLWPLESIKSVQRRLRSIFAENEIDIHIEAYKKPIPEGFNLLIGVSPGNISLQTEFGTEPFAAIIQQWNPVTQRSLLPPLVAIFLAILLRRPVIALGAGVWAGATLINVSAGAGLLAAAGNGFVDVGRKYFSDQLMDRARIEIVLFVVFMLAMVGVITKAGGIHGMMNRIASLAKDVRRTQIATWFMGLSVFFDDYANTILVGSTMRPLADKYRVAREKLAYIVDSTAAPVAGVSILSTWIAFEVSTFSTQLPDAGLAPSDGYAIFIQTLPYRFYSWFTLMFVAFIVFSGRDFGPMLTAERRARSGKIMRDGATPLVGKAATELQADSSVRPLASTAILPLAVFILTTLGTILVTGSFEIGLLQRAEGFPYLAMGSASGSFLETSTGILFGGSGEKPLMYGAIAGFVVASAIALGRGLSIGGILGASFNSLRAMGVALLILYLAWMVGGVCKDLGTADYLAATLYTKTPYVVLPVALFLLSGLIAFSTGSSWSTMTILLPLVVGLAYDIGYQGSPDPAESAKRIFGLFVLIVSIGAVLEGAIFGDHCSPISDTTVMSSIACASDHVDHVRTQAPYAIVTMLTALVVGYFPVVFLGLSPWASLAIGGVILFLIVRLRGKKVDELDAGAQAS